MSWVLTKKCDYVKIELLYLWDSGVCMINDLSWDSQQRIWEWEWFYTPLVVLWFVLLSLTGELCWGTAWTFMYSSPFMYSSSLSPGWDLQQDKASLCSPALLHRVLESRFWGFFPFRAASRPAEAELCAELSPSRAQPAQGVQGELCEWLFHLFIHLLEEQPTLGPVLSPHWWVQNTTSPWD